MSDLGAPRDSIQGLVIFDCDGTLVDSEGISCKVMHEVAAEEGLYVELDYLITRFRGWKMADSIIEIETLLGKKVSSEFVENVRRREREALSLHLRPMQGAEALLRAIKVDICVASNAPVDKTTNSLAVTNLLEFFRGRIFSSYEIGSWKPEPDLFLHAARRMGYRPQSCIVVEDSAAGISAARAAGMQVYALQHGACGFETSDGVQMISQLSDLLRDERFRAFVGVN